MRRVLPWWMVGLIGCTSVHAADGPDAQGPTCGATPCDADTFDAFGADLFDVLALEVDARGRDLATDADREANDADLCGECAPLGARCGYAFDRCGERLSCGTCTATARSLALAMNDMAYDSLRDLVYVSVRGTAGVDGNSVAAIDPNTTSIVWSTFVGSEPTTLVIDSDARRLWVSLSDTRQVREVDLESHEAGESFSLGESVIGDPLSAGALAALPSGGLAVARLEGGIFDSLAIFDEGVMRPITVSAYDGYGGTSLAASSDDTVLGYDGASTLHAVTRFDVDDRGVVGFENRKGLLEGFGVWLTVDGSFVVASNGEVLAPTGPASAGRCWPEGSGRLEVVAGAIGHQATNRIYGAIRGTAASAPVHAILACDRTTFTQIARVDVEPIDGSIVRSAVRAGRGMIFLTRDRVRPDPHLWIVDTTVVAEP